MWESEIKKKKFNDCNYIIFQEKKKTNSNTL